MKEDELRDALRAAMAAASPPPPMSTNETLTAARRVRIRRRAGWACAGSAAAVTVVALVSTALPGMSSNADIFSPAGSGPSTIPPPVTGTSTAEPWPTGPDGKPQEDRTAKAGSRFDQGVRLLNEIVSVVPAGYSAPENPANQPADQMPLRYHQAQFEDKVNGVDLWSYMSSVAVFQGERMGRLLVEVHTAGNTLTDNPCALAQKFWGMPGECQVMTVGAAQVGVVVRPTGRNQFDQWAAYRHPDGTVVFVAQASKDERDGRPPLTALPFSPQQLATLAVDERFHLH
ncbi:MAG TPA: hypothetical protein VFX60_08165 [Micromonospora sp.]|nr:hypothetical protein [Micromonospora sp.]